MNFKVHSVLVCSFGAALAITSIGCNKKSDLKFQEDLSSGRGFNPQFSCTSESSPVATNIRRLSKVYLINSIREFLSPVPTSTRDALVLEFQPLLNQIPEDSDRRFARSDVRLTQSHVDASFEFGVSVAARLAGDATLSNALASICNAGATAASLQDSTCLSRFINYYGRKSFRRPLTTSEVLDFTAFYNSLPAADKLAGLIARFLIHPNFYYELNMEGQKVSGADGVDATYQLTKYELLSKMTFLFWQAPPDDNLYERIATLDLTQAQNRESVLERIIADTRAKKGILDFYSEWLHLNEVTDFGNSTPSFSSLASGENLPAAGAQYKSEMVNEILDLASHYTFSVKGRYDDLLNSPYSFAKGTNLARLYGVAPWSGSPTDLVSFTPGERSGILTRAAFLVASSEYTRPITKAKRVRFQLLCDELPPPPPEADLMPAVQESSLTTAAVFHRATSSKMCMTCHSQLNPLGFATENYDSLGRFRSSETKFDSGGVVVGRVPVQTQVTANIFGGDQTIVQNGVELSSHIARTGKGQQCMTQQFFRYAHARDENLAEDGCALENMRKSLTGGTLLEMFKETVRQKSFTVRKVK